jgi:putative transposase
MAKRKLQSNAHSKHLILYHLIFVAKYRRKIFADKSFGEGLKNEFIAISNKYDFSIDTIDLDYSKPDHIHILVRSIPDLSPAQIVRVLKQEANIWAWQSYSFWLGKFYWKSHHLFTRGYYCGSVGNVSAQQVAEYLEAQGRNDIC